MPEILDDPNEERLGPYVIIGRLASAGKLGEVLRGMDTQLNRYVTLRLLPEELFSKPETVARFEELSGKMLGLDHENIIRCVEVSRESRDVPFVVSEYVDGPLLQDLLDNQAQLPLSILGPFMLQLCRALDYAERQDLCHGSLTPRYIVVTSGDVLKVANFGLLQTMGQLPDIGGIGKLVAPSCYVAPEVLKGDYTGNAVDLWSMGVILYMLLSGTAPFDGPDDETILSAVRKHKMPKMKRSATPKRREIS